MYFVESGCVRCYISDGGTENTIRFGYQDNFIVVLDSFMTKEPTRFYIEALKKTSLKKISREQFNELQDKYPELKEFYLNTLEQLLVDQLEIETDILCASPQARYDRVLKRSPQLFQEVPSKYIATYLRMTPETLSRLKKS